MKGQGMLRLRNIGLLFFLVFMFWGWERGGRLCGADDLLPARPLSSPGTVLIEPPSRDNGKPAAYNLKRWLVEENTDPVRHALEVYKKKSASRFLRRVWLTDKSNGRRRLVVTYTPRAAGDKILFSPDEDFMYYLGAAPGGGSIVYGVNLLSDKKFSLGAADHVNMIRCPDQKGYVVVWKDRSRPVYILYTLTGERMKTVTDVQDPVDLEKSLCR